MTIIVYENTKRSDACRDFLLKNGLESRFRELVLLPIPTCASGSRRLTGGELDVDAALSSVGEGTLVAGYGIPADLALAAKMRGAAVADSALDEDFLRYNGELTALATLGIILTTECRAPRDLRVGVVGYGRIGKSLVRTLLYLGCPVKVYTSRPRVRLDLASYGIEVEESLGSASLSGLDILINTAPAILFDNEARLHDSLRVIDLASGDCFPGCNGVERYPSLPARVFGESAGIAWGRSILRMLGEVGA